MNAEQGISNLEIEHLAFTNFIIHDSLFVIRYSSVPCSIFPIPLIFADFIPPTAGIP
jgi:hypothetical protein